MTEPKNDQVNWGRSKFTQVFNTCLKRWKISTDHQRVLIIGGSAEDEAVLRRAGFTDVVNSNLASDIQRIAGGAAEEAGDAVAMDAEDLNLPDNSFDIVFTYDVLHHCRSPHRAVCEMLRVARRYVIFHEPNDSALMRILARTRFSDAFELPAVFDNDCRAGGVRNLPIPNYVYRWNEREAFKTASSFLAEYQIQVRSCPYWSFRVNPGELNARKETRIGWITAIVGAKTFAFTLRCAEPLLNLLPFLRKQGNKFLCCVENPSVLKPWLKQEGAQISIREDYRKSNGNRTPNSTQRP